MILGNHELRELNRHIFIGYTKNTIGVGLADVRSLGKLKTRF